MISINVFVSVEKNSLSHVRNHFQCARTFSAARRVLSLVYVHCMTAVYVILFFLLLIIFSIDLLLQDIILLYYMRTIKLLIYYTYTGCIFYPCSPYKFFSFLKR